MNHKKESLNNEKMPVLFIGHGSPLNIILRNDFTKSLKKLGRELPKPKAIMVVSAHWLTYGTFVTCMERPKTIHDFFGFPKELYEMEYPSPGAPGSAGMVVDLARKTKVKCGDNWGLDHASWAILKHIYPEADIPVFEMSLDFSFNEWRPKALKYHYDLAAELFELRKKGVLIIGSGNIVHNLGMLDFHNIEAQPYDWALQFDEKVKENLINKNHQGLIDYLSMKGASWAAPTLDHYLPMIYVIALQEEKEDIVFTYEGFHYGSVSMRCFQIG